MKRALTPTKPWALVLTLMLPALSVGCTAAYAYDYCRQDVTGHMTSCSFDTLEQCQASGIGGDCFRDPFLKEHNAYALQLKRRNMRPAKAGTHARHRYAVGNRTGQDGSHWLAEFSPVKGSCQPDLRHGAVIRVS